ncbi:hypothetical protein ABVK25_012564 [Lepraria finkii]|uniref:Uncharacterized protein n=1 Tax=Lepraria finkii TaxID=1340010 RepID=A0ABR4ACR2_9LECA
MSTPRERNTGRGARDSRRRALARRSLKSWRQNLQGFDGQRVTTSRRRIDFPRTPDRQVPARRACGKGWTPILTAWRSPDVAKKDGGGGWLRGSAKSAGHHQQLVREATDAQRGMTCTLAVTDRRVVETPLPLKRRICAFPRNGPPRGRATAEARASSGSGRRLLTGDATARRRPAAGEGVFLASPFSRMTARPPTPPLATHGR